MRIFHFREELDRTLARLEAVWDDIGLNEEQRKERRHHFNGHIVVSLYATAIFNIGYFVF